MTRRRARVRRSVTFRRRRTNHYLHLRLTGWTLCMWLPFWLAVWAINAWGPRQRVTRKYYRW